MSYENDLIQIRQQLQKLQVGLIDGQQVFTTYHDSNLTATPANPTGDGSTGGWHVLPTTVSRWYSVKTALKITGGTWGDPVWVPGYISNIPVNMADCVGHWKLNENEANTLVADSSGRSNHGAGSVDTDQMSVSGKIGNAFSLNGSSEYVTIPDHTDYDFSDAFSVFVDIKPTAVGIADGIVTKYRSSGELREWALDLIDVSGSDAKLIVVLGTSGGTGASNQTTDNLVVSNGGWYHIGFSYNAGVVKIYVNSIEVDSTKTGTHVTTLNKEAVDIEIGRYNGGVYFDGAIDNVMIFDKVLSQGEINYLYNNGDGTETLVKDAVTDGAGISIDVPMLSGIEFIGDGASKVGWTSGTIDYYGTRYNITSKAVGDGSTNEFIYWDADDGNTSFKTTATLATAIGAGNWVVCINSSGVATPAAVHKVLLGGLIQADTITAESIVAGTITFTELRQVGGSEAVDTAAIRDNAATKTASSYTSGSVSVGTSDTQLVTASITTASGAVEISAAAAIAGASSSSKITLSIWRAVGYKLYEAINLHAGTDPSQFSAVYMDTPGVGTFTYVFYAKIDSGAGSAHARSIVLKEFKK